MFILHDAYLIIQEPRKVPFIQQNTESTLGWSGWSSAKDTPEGGWNKGALTTTLIQFVEAFCQRHSVETSARDEHLRLTVSALIWS